VTVLPGSDAQPWQLAAGFESAARRNAVPFGHKIVAGAKRVGWRVENTRRLDDSLYATAIHGIPHGHGCQYGVCDRCLRGMKIGELFASVGSEKPFGTVNLSTGLFTTDVGSLNSPHGLAFEATPEPETRTLALGGLLLLLAGQALPAQPPAKVMLDSASQISLGDLRRVT
jgi:hypothetical protein